MRPLPLTSHATPRRGERFHHCLFIPVFAFFGNPAFAGTALGNPMEELLRTASELDLDPAAQDRLGELIRSAQVGSLLDQRIAQLILGGQDPGPQASARKLIGVRYRQVLSEFRMELSDGAGVVENKEVHDFLNTRCLTIAGGTEQILLTLAGERLLGLPR